MTQVRTQGDIAPEPSDPQRADPQRADPLGRVAEDSGPGSVGLLGPAGAAVTAAGFATNALAYVVPLLGARQLSADGLSALTTLLAIGAIATVPALGLQAALAVEWSRRGAVSNAGRATIVTAAALTAMMIAATPLISLILRVSPALGLLLAVTNAAVVLASRWLGQLQGTQRFGRLAAGMALLALARYGGVIVGLTAGAGVAGSLALGAAVGWFLLPVLALLTRGVGTSSAGDGPAGRLTARTITDASGATLAMLATSYADLIVARHMLPAGEAGAYAVGSVLTKGALWAPQVVTVLALPRLAHGSRRTLFGALSVVGACGIALVLASFFAGDLAMRLAGGAAYATLGRYAVGFATVGALYALAYVLVNAEIAARVRWPGAPLWAALVGLVVATQLLDPPAVGTILTVSVATAATAVATMSIIVFRRRPVPSPQETQ